MGPQGRRWASNHQLIAGKPTGGGAFGNFRGVTFLSVASFREPAGVPERGGAGQRRSGPLQRTCAPTPDGDGARRGHEELRAEARAGQPQQGRCRRVPGTRRCWGRRKLENRLFGHVHASSLLPGPGERPHTCAVCCHLPSRAVGARVGTFPGVSRCAPRPHPQ